MLNKTPSLTKFILETKLNEMFVIVLRKKLQLTTIFLVVVHILYFLPNVEEQMN